MEDAEANPQHCDKGRMWALLIRATRQVVLTKSFYLLETSQRFLASPFYLPLTFFFFFSYSLDNLRLRTVRQAEDAVMDNASHAALHAALSGFRWSPALPHLPATSSFLKGRRGAEIRIRLSLRSCVCEREAFIKKPKDNRAVAHVCQPIPLRTNQ